METSQTIAKISAALVKAQAEMGNAKKESTNPFFNKKYADLNAIREAVLPVLNKHGIAVIQPTIVGENNNYRNYVKTILLHESGEYISGLTEIVCSRPNDAQAHGSGLTYARRYGLQSIVNVGADDDDGNSASQPVKVKESLKESKPLPSLPESKADSVVDFLQKGGTIQQVQKKYDLTETQLHYFEQILKAKQS
jgi:hypothetical protein